MITYPLQGPVWDVKRVKVFQTLCDIKQLARIRSTELVVCCSCHIDGNFPHQGCSACVGMQLYVFIDVAVLSPVVNEGELEMRHVDAEKR